MAGLMTLGALGDQGARGESERGTTGTEAAEPPERHLPVWVRGDWLHRPVHVLAARPPAEKPLSPQAEPTKPRLSALPKPFAALRLAASPLIMPRLRLPRAIGPSFPALRSLLARARPGQPVHVMLSAYCLRGRTRRGTEVRPGIIAADPRVFPLARHVELYAAGRYLGRFKVEDTGSAIRGTRIDIWTPDCGDAIRFGMRAGVAELVAVGD
jgi:3D (Asp-Asp-Asp) domain-containing protein